MAVATEYIDFPTPGSYVTGWGFPRVTLAWECVKCGARGKKIPLGSSTTSPMSAHLTDLVHLQFSGNPG